MRKPKRVDNRKHKTKNFSYLIKSNKSNHNKKEGNKMANHTVRGSNGKSVIRNAEEVFKPMIFSDINYLLSGSQSLTDIDGQLEINGNIFIIESKTHYNSINGGQLVSLFHNVYNTWKRGKVGQLTYRVSTNKFNNKGEELFDYVVYGSAQFKQFEAGIEITPHYELDKTNSWLAERLRAFQDVCHETHDKDLYIKNTKLFSSINGIKGHLKNRGKQLPF